jgi:protein-S-isoprenylcysteine O-methyltransferase Ste14
MEASFKLRFFGTFSCVVIIFVYLYEIHQQLEAWLSFETISEITTCHEVYALEVWLLVQSSIWVVSLSFMILSFLKPDYVKFLLCFMYFVGPVFFIWTCFAMIAQFSFMACCAEEGDKCKDFYPYKYWKNFYILLGASFLFSLSISVILLGILLGSLMNRLRNYWNLYQDI